MRARSCVDPGGLWVGIVLGIHSSQENANVWNESPPTDTIASVGGLH